MKHRIRFVKSFQDAHERSRQKPEILDRECENHFHHLPSFALNVLSNVLVYKFLSWIRVRPAETAIERETLLCCSLKGTLLHDTGNVAVTMPQQENSAACCAFP